MHEKLLLRELYGPVFITVLDNGQRIPWSPLSVGDYLYFEDLFQSGQYPSAFIENEIFKKCVKNPVLVNQIDKLKAGIVSTVVTTIMVNSSPSNLEGMEYQLNLARIKSNAILHDMVNMVCQAYPAYKPEEIYTMDFNTLISRVAIAERKLLNTGILKEPISFLQKEDEPTKQKKVSEQPKPSVPPPVNMAKEFKKQSEPQQQTIITKADIKEHQTAYTGHEKEDKIILERQMLEDTKNVYGDYLKQMKTGQKVVIKTTEERKAEALARSEENRKKNIELVIQNKEKEKAELERFAKIRKVQRTVRKKK